MEELAQLILKTYGIAGLLLLTPLIAVKLIWDHSKEQGRQLQAANERVNETHAKRVDDAKQIADRLMGMVQEHAELSKETNMALERVGDLLSILQNSAVQLRVSRSKRPTNKDDEDYP